MAAQQGTSTGAQPAFVQREDGLRHPSPAHARAFLGLLRAGEMLDRALDAELKAAHGLSLRGFEVLLHLAVFSSNGRLRMSVLAEQAPLSQSRVSRLVDELQERGLVERRRFAGDARGVEVAITQRGVDALRQAQDTHFSGLQQRLFSRLSWEETVQLGELTARILDPKDRTSSPEG